MLRELGLKTGLKLRRYENVLAELGLVGVRLLLRTLKGGETKGW